MIVLTSCAEDIFTPGEIAGKEIKSQVDKHQIRKANVFEWRIHSNGYSEWEKVVNENDFSIAGQYFVVGNSYYDLNKLYRFSVDDVNKIVSIYLK